MNEYVLAVMLCHAHIDKLLGSWKPLCKKIGFSYNNALVSLGQFFS